MTDPTFLILYLVKRYGDQISAGIWPISTRNSPANDSLLADGYTVRRFEADCP